MIICVICQIIVEVERTAEMKKEFVIDGVSGIKEK